jgi:hypothetical protein
MRLLIPILVVLGMGCVVPDNSYGYSSGAYVAYTGPAYPVYLADGYYWSYYNDGWYWWANDRWSYSYSRPRSPVRIHLGSDGGYHHPGQSVTVRDHRTNRVRSAPNARSAPRYRAPTRSTPPPTRSTPTVRDHRRR